ncbi:hypothetical protein BaRGS_00006160 [Batillaria attramentaria]|uniref:Uncharacterized protein n=1 Tax=Batillaria attramentaria TaxID=370345 RepID=A0ABD0LST4_9CAEN
MKIVRTGPNSRTKVKVKFFRSTHTDIFYVPTLEIRYTNTRMFPPTPGSSHSFQKELELDKLCGRRWKIRDEPPKEMNAHITSTSYQLVEEELLPFS